MSIRTYIRRKKLEYKRVDITYGITVCNEAAELTALLKNVFQQKSRHDEVLVLQDITNPSPEVNAILKSYGNRISLVQSKLNNDFATFKNQLIENAKGEYLFQIDADELLSEGFVRLLKYMIKLEPYNDVFLVARENFVEGITQEHMDKWKIQMDEKGRLNFPDYQYRIIKMNGKVKWKNKVHEVFIGFGSEFKLPTALYLIHKKTIKKQEKQNDYYDTLTQ